ncbi:hypothetical protein HS088_TW16G00607 [Tripterygium wilfordii]|uniref:Uncharacterized protein n=1 Tax=Tripterygium wilfordii TaxID=458696 RepID=A0A7J7CJB2_TRIWF|nr:hypothetical protein HS088_TW16G00607 [Tripterygium wilfordii]
MDNRMRKESSIQLIKTSANLQDSLSVEGGVGMSGEEKSRRSFCEDSMKMVTNIIKLSSFSIAKLTLGTASSSSSSSPVAVKSLAPEVARSCSGSGSGSGSVMVPQIPGSRRSQKPRSSSKPVSFVMQPADRENESSSYVIHEEKKSVIDDQASDYISKVRKKNRKYLDETSMHYQDIVPPPPRLMK